ncbi:MAG TPA: signal peptide peptidase SppA [bacterium]|nr:signal peptide peptidase SppA [bacterium]HPQ66912.1 signal peptide peptidase SppA [bacterium]
MSNREIVLPDSKIVYLVRKRRIWPWLLLGLGLGFFAAAALLLDEENKPVSAWPRLNEAVVSGSGAAKIALIRVGGIIRDEDESVGFKTRNVVSEFSAALRAAAADESVKAVILTVDSPGGGITASDVMYHRLLDFKKSGKPVVALLGDIAASGGYYIAAPADLIYAHPTSITGSIGVIIQSFNVESLMRKIGVEDVTIKAGEQKDMLSPFRQLTPGEYEELQALVNGMHERFIQVIVQNRGLPEEDVRAAADGRIFDAEEAFQAGLVDEIGYLEDAIAAAEELAGIESSTVVEYQPHFGVLSLLGASFPAPLAVRLLERLEAAATPRLMYLWRL